MIASSITKIATLLSNKIKAISAAGLYLVDDGDNGMFIEDGGNIGMGITDPTEKLHVVGNIKASGNVTSGSVTTVALACTARQLVKPGLPVGTEKVVNGSFAADSDWTKTGGATISGGYGNVGMGGLSQVVAVEKGSVYTLSFNNSTGKISVAMSEFGFIATDLAPGAHSIEVSGNITGEIGSATLLFGNSDNASTTIDNVSLTQKSLCVLTPSNLVIEVSNSPAYDDPEMTVAAGSLPDNSIINIVCVATGTANNLRLTLNSGPILEFPEGRSGVTLIKSSVGWIPTLGPTIYVAI